MKSVYSAKIYLDGKSFPSRGTWIEIIERKGVMSQGRVVPLAGNVD